MPSAQPFPTTRHDPVTKTRRRRRFAA